MRNLIKVLLIILCLYNCDNETISSIDYKTWNESVKNLIDKNDLPDKALINSTLKEITDSDFQKLKDIVELKRVNNEFIVIKSFEGEVVTKKVIYISEGNGETAWSTLTIQRGEKKFSKMKSSGNTKFSTALDNVANSNMVYEDSIIVTSRVNEKVISKFVNVTDSLLEFR